MRIQHNIMAMSAYRNYTNNVSAMKKNLEKLSSGYKINRAGDDAAGLAISEKMRAQITGLETAQKNAKDGISLVQTAEGALTEVHDMLNRMVELATQSANGTYDNTTDRAQMQKEINQLRSEINRIADSSNFNGINLLDGSMESKVAVNGAQDLFADGLLKVVSDGQLGNKEQAGVFELDLTEFKATANADTVELSLFENSVSVALDGYADDTKFTISGEEDATLSLDEFAQKIATAFNGDDGTGMDFTTEYGVKLYAEASGGKITFTMKDANGDTAAPSKAWDKNVAGANSNIITSGLKANYGDGATVDNEGDVANQAYGMRFSTIQEPVDSSMARTYATAKIDVSKLNIKDGTALTIGDTTYTFAVGRDSKFKNGENVINLTDISADEVSKNAAKVANRITTAALGNKNFKVTASTAVSGTDADKYIYLTEKEGGVDTDNYKLEGKPNVNADGTEGKNKDGDWTGLVKFGKVDPNANKGLTLQIGDTADSFNQLKVSIKDMHTDSMGIGDISIADQDSAQKAVKAIKEAINYVSDVRGTLGATQNRLDHTINNLSVMTENIQDAESTIRDVDVAEEMMAYTKNNILIQSAQAMLAQANQVPQGVLQLLG